METETMMMQPVNDRMIRFNRSKKTPTRAELLMRGFRESQEAMKNYNEVMKKNETKDCNCTDNRTGNTCGS